jgi:helix-turn-helix protein
MFQDAVSTVKEQSFMRQNLRSDASTQAETKTRNGGTQTVCVKKIEDDKNLRRDASTQTETKTRNGGTQTVCVKKIEDDQNLRSDASTQAETKTRNGGTQTEYLAKIEEDLTRHKYAMTEYEERIKKLEVSNSRFWLLCHNALKYTFLIKYISVSQTREFHISFNSSPIIVH